MLLNTFFIILKQCLQRIPLVVQTNENHLELSLVCIADVVTITSPIYSIFCTVWQVLCGKNHCHAKEWHLSAANLVAFCKLLVVIDQTVTYSNSAFTLGLHPWDIKFTRTTHYLSKKTQAIPLPADEFLGLGEDTCFHCTDHHWLSGTWWTHEPMSHHTTFHSYILQTICDKFQHFLQFLQLKFDYCFLLVPKINTHCLFLHNNDITAWHHK